MRFDEVIKIYGYPVISKEVAYTVQYAKYDEDNEPNACMKKMIGQKFEKDGTKSRFNLEKYSYLLDAPFHISDQCCRVMKKRPAHQYEKNTSRKPILGTMASESRLRLNSWIKTGCNAFEDKRPSSQPMSFWTEQDIFQYIKKYNLPYATVYGDIIEDSCGKLCTSGADRTGCIFCMFGAHLEKEPNRFQRLKQTHPKQYEYCMKPIARGGLGLDEVLTYLNINH